MIHLSSIQNVKVGIEEVKKKQRIYATPQKNISKSIAAKEAGEYYVFVQNKSGKTITVSGGYSF